MSHALRPLTLLAAAGLATVLFGCDGAASSSDGGASGDGASASGEKEQVRYSIGVIAKSQSNPVFQAARTGAERAATDLSESLDTDAVDVTVTVDWRTPTNEDAQQQAQNLEQLASGGVNGIAISASDAGLLRSAIDDAVDRGVEVVCFDSDVPESKRFAYYGIDDVEAGREVARQLVNEMGEEGVVAILGGNQNAPNLQARIRGVQEVLGEHDGISIKGEYYHPETATDAAQKVQTVQSANPDITGWAMVGGWPLFTENALDGVHEQAKVVSVDHLPEQLKYVEASQVQALVGQDCFGWGYQSVVMLIDKLHKNVTPERVINNFELSIVNGGNVEEYKGIWDEWLNRD
ncbi:MAG: substrate-binding domain-containing protein [Planctomycetota bacterium]